LSFLFFFFNTIH